jgi:hypothetical protein
MRKTYAMIILALTAYLIPLTLTIGTETLQQRHPLGDFYGYERSAAIYTDAELGNSNNRISALAWYAETAVTLSVPTKVYLKRTTATTVSTAYWADMVYGATLVYDYTVPSTIVGWNVLTLSKTFDSDNGTGVLVLVERDHGGSGSGNVSGSGIRGSYIMAGNMHQVWGNNNTVPSGTGTINSVRPNIQITYTTYNNAVPGPAVMLTPYDASTGVEIGATLNWSSGGGLPSGYKLFFGTDDPPSNIVNGTNLGLVTTYDPNLYPNTTYYWKIVPTNTQGDAQNCPVWSFTTGSGVITLNSPSNSASGLNNTGIAFSWNSGSGATSYRITIGTLSGASDIVNSSQTGTSYTLSPVLSYNTTYYWSVYATYPGAKYEVKSEERTFTIMPDPAIVSFPHYEDFEDTVFPPSGWKVIDNNADNDKWSQSTINANSSYRCARIYTNFNLANDDYLITPEVHLTGNQELKFWIRSQSATDYDEISVLLSSTTAVPASFTTVLMPSTTVNYINYKEYVINLSAQTGVKYIAFVRKSTPVDGWNLYLDDITFRDIPTAPILTYSPSSISFKKNIQGTPSAWSNVTVTNTGAGILNLASSNIIITGTDPSQFEFSSSNLPAALTYGQSVNIPVRFTATSDGDKSAILRIDYGAKAFYDVALSGEGLPEGMLVFTGTGLANYNIPIKPSFRYSYSQSVYLQPEINIAGTIEKIFYNWHGVNGAPNSNIWTVYMGHTTEDYFDSTNTWLPIMDLTEVYQGGVDLPAYKDWIEIELSTPFQYNNSWNLLIAVDENIAAYDGSSEAFLAYPTATDRSLLHYDDYTNCNPSNPVGGSRVAAVPELMMLITAQVTLDPPVVSTSADGTFLTLSWDPVANANSYNVYISDDPYASDPWTLLGSTADTNYIYTTSDTKKFFKVTADTQTVVKISK